MGRDAGLARLCYLAYPKVLDSLEKPGQSGYAKLLETSKQFARRVIFIFRVKHVALAEPALGFQILGPQAGGLLVIELSISLSVLIYDPPNFGVLKPP